LPGKLLKPYLLAARPKTLPAAAVPVWVGCALSWKLDGRLDWFLAGCTLVAALCVQIATNLFNDVLDAEKGADTSRRLGPRRVTASGLLSRRAVYAGAIAFLVVAGLAAVPLWAARGWLVAAIGVPSAYFAYGYTGGPFPLAYRGLGELFVILFFGVVAVGGTVFVQTGEWGWEALVVGLQTGLLSAALITINNLRDVDEDRRSGKETLAVRWGPEFVKLLLFAGELDAMILTVFGIWYGAPWWPALSLVWFLPGLGVAAGVLKTAPGPVYNRYLAMAALQLVLFAAAFTAAVGI